MTYWPILDCHKNVQKKKKKRRMKCYKFVLKNCCILLESNHINKNTAEANAKNTNTNTKKRNC